MSRNRQWRKLLLKSGGGVGLFLLLGLVSACSGAGRDGALSTPPRLPDIADAKPRVEPKSKYGNPKSYVVFGKRYYTKASSRGHVERGMASWYGKMFHGRKTSNGERYNMYAMTAAHKALPLPTYARVTNLTNRRSVVVRINDRGPFYGNRVIDLSYAAARKLGMAAKGTAMVEVRTIDPRRPGSDRRSGRFASKRTPAVEKSTWRAGKVATQAVKERPVRGRVAVTTTRGRPRHAARPSTYLQVGAFGNRANAERLRHRLAKHITGQQIRVRTISDENTPWHKVRVGPFDSRESANNLSRQLASLGLEGFHIITE